jgi:predicted lipoprotein with Yx(FWY)xxD motif
MHRYARVRWLGVGLAVSAVLAACGSQSPSSSSSASTATPSPSATPVVITKTVGSEGNILVAGSNGMTVYTFTKDTAGVSNCKAACLVNWPALTVPSGQTPTGGSGVNGQLATITRDDGAVQVTYKGLPLYFFHSDSKPGDINGKYANWNLVKP